MELAGAGNIAGYYHSHPHGDTTPSLHDKNLAVPGMTYLIVAVGEGPVRHAAWRMEEGEFVQVPLEVRE